MNEKMEEREPILSYSREEGSAYMKKSVRPDFLISSARHEQDPAPKPVFVLEAKKIDENKALRDHLPQLFDYLRLLCLKNGYTHLWGVLTNYKSWIFVRYDLISEIETVQTDKVAEN
eukprot:CAMPEP_0170453078 /NCGR_PEP_ID=MMETSP0123-20130129/1776_1 /TAXON_ID=182087 /ORGANISM="Favella ehrenbergii, Strain Fehren 1" /LENGTH=116 /DNA_ID=CAMNT_0010715323 /DNA_START=386 /DNA_END=736 /DNA_ORIENTATION=-